MRKKYFIANVMFLACLMVGCNKQSDEVNNSPSGASTNDTSVNASNAWQNTKEAGSNALGAAKSMATNAWEGAKEAGSNVWQKGKSAFGAGAETDEVSTNYYGYDYSMKDAFISEARTNLDKVDQNTASLSNRVANAGGSTQTELQQTMQNINEKRADLDTKYNAVKNATQDNWNDAKAAFAKSYYDLKASLKAGWDSVTSKL